jgi:hypothetical protein
MRSPPESVLSRYFDSTALERPQRLLEQRAALRRLARRGDGAEESVDLRDGEAVLRPRGHQERHRLAEVADRGGAGPDRVGVPPGRGDRRLDDRRPPDRRDVLFPLGEGRAGEQPGADGQLLGSRARSACARIATFARRPRDEATRSSASASVR